EVPLYEVLWQTEDVTSMVPAIALKGRQAATARLRLRWLDQEVVVDEHHPSVTIGRAEDNDLVVKGNLISRLHARIELSRNKLVLIDQSTNGTFVQTLADEGLLPPQGLHEGAVGALVYQHELVAAELDPCVQAGDEIPLHDEIVVLGTPDGDARVMLVDHYLTVEPA